VGWAGVCDVQGTCGCFISHAHTSHISYTKHTQCALSTSLADVHKHGNKHGINRHSNATNTHLRQSDRSMYSTEHPSGLTQFLLPHTQKNAVCVRLAGMCFCDAREHHWRITGCGTWVIGTSGIHFVQRLYVPQLTSAEQSGKTDCLRINLNRFVEKDYFIPVDTTGLRLYTCVTFSAKKLMSCKNFHSKTV
jgi:hypothetical protein